MKILCYILHKLYSFVQSATYTHYSFQNEFKYKFQLMILIFGLIYSLGGVNITNGKQKCYCFRYNDVLSHVSKGGEELGTVYARFIKERAEIERDYAKNLRKLVSKYNDKTSDNKKSKETSQAKGFR